MISMMGLAQKTDKVWLKNGDVVTGEIKYMKFAKLTIDQTGPGKINIKWEEITRIRSEKTLQVTLQDGRVLITKLDSVFFEVQQNSLDDIIEIIWIKDKFLQRLSGDINLGANYAKSSDIFTFNLNSSITYRVPKNEVNFKGNSVITSSASDTSRSLKQDIMLTYYRRLERSFYTGGSLGWEQNDQLGLNNRFSVTGVGGKILMSNNRHRLLTGLGLSFNQEQSNETKDYTKNLEALAVIQYKEFHYSFPKLSIDAQYAFFPSLTDWGRVRMNFQINTSIEIFKDFNVGLSFYDNFDSRPPAGAASKNDFGINFTIGYFFGK